MRLLDYIKEKKIKHLEVIDAIILSVQVDDTLVALDVNTDNIIQGTKVDIIYDFEIENDIISFNDITHDLTQIHVLI